MKKFALIFVQLIVGFIAAAAVYAGGIGNGWELVAIPIVCAIGISLVGIAFQRVTNETHRPITRLFLGALFVSTIGAAILLIPGAWGFQAILLPIGGAIVGYQLADRF